MNAIKIIPTQKREQKCLAIKHLSLQYMSKLF